MDTEQLARLDTDELCEYLWGRLRREPPLDPPLGRRFGDEDPEQFLIQAAEEIKDPEFPQRLGEAITLNLQRLSRETTPSEPDSGSGPGVVDEQIASLAFLVSALKASDLVGALYLFASAWFIGNSEGSHPLSFGQTHVLRTLAELQEGAWLASFWRSLWERGPRDLRGLAFFGWVRAEREQPLRRLGELVRSADHIDLPATVWRVIGSGGLSVIELAQAAAACPVSQRQALRQALADAGADSVMLRDFERHSRLRSQSHAGFPWPFPDDGAPRKRPRWAA